MKASKLKIDALLEWSRCRGVGEWQQRIRHESHDTSNGPIEVLGFRFLLNQQHTLIREGNAVPQQQRGASFGREQLAREGTIRFYAKQYWPRVSDKKSNYSYTWCRQWKWVLACKEMPFDERRFLSREPHSWQGRCVPSLSAADITNTKYVRVQMYLEDKM